MMKFDSVVWRAEN